MGDTEEFVRAAWTIGITVVVLFVVIIAAGFWLLARRARHGPSPDSRATSSQQKANILLVRVDDAVTRGEEELSFAIAQFGAEVTGGYARALAAGRQKLTEAFALQQRLDDAHPDTEIQRRDWTARIIQLCETTQDALESEAAQFDQLRQLEKNAPANLKAVRDSISALHDRRSSAVTTLDGLRKSYAASAVAPVADNLQRADEAIAEAAVLAASADSALGDTSTTATVDSIRSATDSTRAATHLFDAIDTLAAELGKATDAAAALVEATRDSLVEARHVRDNPPDAAVGAAVGAAIAKVEKNLAELDAGDPIRALDHLREVNAALDVSLAGARNQRQRLDGARTALAGALVAARSQLAVTHDFIAARRGSVGADARTRLAEAERLLRLAEAEADPVIALDTARSSATYSRDADALARYSVH